MYQEMTVDPDNKVEPGLERQFFVRVSENLETVRTVRGSGVCVTRCRLAIETTDEAIQSTEHSEREETDPITKGRRSHGQFH